MSMQNAKNIDQKAYLKKYLSGDKEKKKKKKDKKHKKLAKVKIIDDDAYHDADEDVNEDLLFGGEDAPQIVGEYIEDDPNVRSKWRNIAVKDELEAEDAVHMKQERQQEDESSLWGRKATAINIKQEYSPSRRKQRTTPDASPARRRNVEHSPPAIKIKQEKRSSSRDLSPPRPKRADSSDQSPPRKRRDSDQSPPRKRRDSDQSPPRRRRRNSNQSPPKKRRDSDQSPPRRRRDSDQSPPRRRRDSDQSPPRRKRSPQRSPTRRRRDADHSPRRRQSPTRRRRDADQLPSRRRNQSPRRNQRRNGSASQSPPSRRRSRDLSTLKKYKRSPSTEHSPTRRLKKEARGSHSPPPVRKSRWAKATPSKSPSPPPTHKPKAEKTLDGKKAGLQDAHSLKTETDERRRQERRLFEQMSSELSGRDAEIQIRSTGRRGKRARAAAEEDPEERRRKEEREQKKKEIYERWGKGVKQVEDHKARLADMVHEASKPVARYANDEDLDRHLREQEHADDPMLEYMKQKRKKLEKDSNKPVLPVYEGSYPENRYGIRPGYRWDGVDRSNGYEQRWFDKQNEKRAIQDEAYKYSVEDM